MAHIIKSFKRSSAEERAVALDGIVEALNPYEWRRVQSFLQTRTFQVDIIGSSKLPLELVINIFSYLDLADAFRYQCVSRSWRRVLNSTLVIDQFLKPWYFPTDPPLLCELSGSVDELAVVRKKAEHLHRFRTGRPSAHCTVQISDEISTLDDNYGNFKFAGETVAWITKTQGTVATFNLRTGRCNRIITEGRVGVLTICMTARYLACVTFGGHVFAYHLNDEGGQSSSILNSCQYLRLPSPIITTSGGEQNIMVFITRDQLYNSEVVVWDISSNRSHTFLMPVESINVHVPPVDNQIRVPLKHGPILVNKAEERIVVFSGTKMKPPLLRCRKFDLNGTHIDEQDLDTFQVFPFFKDGNSRPYISVTRSIGTLDDFTIENALGREFAGLDAIERGSSRLAWKSIAYRTDISGKGVPVQIRDDWADRTVVRDVLPLITNDISGTEMEEDEESAPEDDDPQPAPIYQRYHSMLWRSSRFRILGDERFVVLFVSDAFHVMAFDPDLEMDESYICIG